MSPLPGRRRGLGAVALLATLASALPAVPRPPPARAQIQAECTRPGANTPEVFGPTDISAATGNRRLSVGINREGTVTVLKWPSPSFYDQIKYKTTGRSEPRFGALPNEGAFIGIATPTGDEGRWSFSWLRDLDSTQRYSDDDADEVVTTFRSRRLGLTITMRDVVAARSDVLVRELRVARSRSSPVRRVRVIAFANFNPVFSKARQAPYEDWCDETGTDSGATYDEKADAVIATRSGVDESTGRNSSVALALGFLSRSEQHQVGADTYETPAGGASAYDDAQDGKLSGLSISAGQSDAAVADDMTLSKRRAATSTVAIAAAGSPEGVTRALNRIRQRTARRIRAEKRNWWRAWLRGAAIPRRAPKPVVRLAKRSLISIRQTADRRGLIVASIATQSPYGLDWVGDGAYVNRALTQAGHPEMVERHNRRYADLQATTVDKPPGGETTPSGNWAMNFYADGVVGGSIPYEIDETGLGMWTLWDHYLQTDDEAYLLDVYEAIQRSAQYLSDVCRDPSTGLQCVANEGDDPNPSRTLVGAQAVWLGLDSAARAARERARLVENGRNIALANAQKWKTRRNELGEAIDRAFFDADCRCYANQHRIGGTLLWPVGLVDYRTKRARSQAEVNWRDVAPAFRGKEERGGYETRALLGNSYVWRGTSKMRRIRRGLRWVATRPTTDSTGILGEAWMVYPPDRGRITTMVSQPHTLSHALFYLASLQAYGKARWSD